MAQIDKFEDSPWYCGAAHGILTAGDPYTLINRPSLYSTKPTLTRSFDLGDLTPVDYFRKHGKIGNFIPDTSKHRGDYEEFSKGRLHLADSSDDNVATRIHQEDLSEADRSARPQISYGAGLDEIEKEVHWAVNTAFDGASDKGSVVTEYTIKRNASPGIEEHHTSSYGNSGPEWIDIPVHARPYGDYVTTAQEDRHRTPNYQSEKPKPTGNYHNPSSRGHHAPPAYHMMLEGASPSQMKLKLFEKLLNKFSEDRIFLEQTMGRFAQPKARKTRPNSNIHVFVDFSNVSLR